MKKTALVTGGAGFIGTHLCRRLYQEGYRVVSLDNYFSGSKKNHIDGVEYIEGHTKDIQSLITFRPDILFHLGEYARVRHSLEEPQLVLDLNTVGTARVVEFWRTHGMKLVYAGSSTKFAQPRADGVEGKDRSPYSWSKAMNCELVSNYGRWYGLPFAIAYFYNVYGPGERPSDQYGTFIETLRQNVLHGTPHHIASPGTQTRAFTHVDDTVSALYLIGEKGEGDGYNIGAKEVYSLLDVAKLFGGEVVIDAQTPSTRSSGAEDTTKLQALGWVQERTLEEYIHSSLNRV